MKRRMLSVKKGFGICVTLALALFPAVSTAANSAQRYWTGTTASGAIVTDEECPLVVEKEILTFEVPEFPEQYYQEIDDYLAYDGSVTAQYTFRNPSENTVTATLVFPFGTVPNYGYLQDRETGEVFLNADTEKYGIMVDGGETEKILRHTLSLYGEQFELERDMGLLHEGYVKDTFYSPDLPVTRYTYEPEEVDTETYTAASAAFVLSADPEKTKVLMENQSGGTLQKDSVRLESWVEQDRPFVVNVIGEPLEQMPDWKFYENGACEKEIEGTMVLAGTETTTLKELLLSEYQTESGVLEYDWYNAAVAMLNLSEWEYGAVSGTEFTFDLSERLMRWYEYEITVPPGETIVNTVTAPLYPSIDTGYRPPVYEYRYLTSPAKTWAEFGTLEIVIHTPYYRIKSEPEGFEKTEDGYVCQLKGLPEDELMFWLCGEEEPESLYYSSDAFPAGAAAAGLATVLILAVVLAAVIRKRKKGNKVR